MNKKRIIILVILLLLFVGCTKNDPTNINQETNTETNNQENQTVQEDQNDNGEQIDITIDSQKASFETNENEKIKAKHELDKLSISDLEINCMDQFCAIRGNIKNNSSSNLKDLYLKLTLKLEDGDYSDSVCIDKLNAKDKYYFEIQTTNLKVINASDYTISYMSDTEIEELKKLFD